MAHSILSPSSAHVWVKCPASISVNAAYGKNRTNSAAEEGTAVHEIAAGLILGQPIPESVNNVIITPEMWEAAEWYAGQIGLGFVLVEQKLVIPRVHPDCWGTCDAIQVLDNELIINDLKYGHIQVDAFENWQLLCYASGYLNNATPSNPVDKVTLRIYQCRPTPKVSEWTISLTEFRKYEERLRTAAYKAMEPNPVAIHGEHCKYCAGRHACPALGSASYLAIESAFDQLLDPAPNQIASELKELYAGRDAISYRIAGLEAEAISLIMQGGKIPGFKMASKDSALKWTIPVEEVITLGDMCNVRLAKPNVITPLQAKKAGLPADLLGLYAAREQGAPQLTPCDENKDAIKIFGIRGE